MQPVYKATEEPGQKLVREFIECNIVSVLHQRLQCKQEATVFHNERLHDAKTTPRTQPPLMRERFYSSSSVNLKL